MSQGIRLTVFLSTCLLGAGIGIAVMPVETQPARIPSPPLPDEPQPEWDLPPLDHFRATLERPLFVRGRTPPEAPVPAPPNSKPAPPASAPSLSVAGIVIAGERRFAWVQIKGAPEPVALTKGGEVSGWIVASISDGGIRMEKDGMAFEVGLREFGKD